MNKRNFTERAKRVVFDKWRNLLNEISYEYSEDDFIKHSTHFLENELLPFKTKSSMALAFYEERYPFLDYEEIHKRAKAAVLEKRGSMYDPKNIAKQQNISLEEAKKIAEDRKSKTNGSLETYISRYGEKEGTRRFEEFKQKCIVSKESLIEKHGNEEGLKKWENYKNSRDSNSYDYFLKKCNGDKELAQQRYIETCAKIGQINTDDYLLKTKGEEYVKQRRYSQAYKLTEDYFIEQYGEELGSIKYKELNERKKVTLKNMIKKHGEELGVVKYKRWLELTNPRNIINKQSGGTVSHYANLFFSELEELLDRELQYGSKKDELVIRLDNGKRFYYDCYDKQTNTIIEFHSSAIHASPLLSDDEKRNWKHAYSGASYEETYAYDLWKKQTTIDHGFNFIEIWDYDVKSNIVKNKTLLNLKERLSQC